MCLHCNKDSIPYQNKKYYKVKNNADSDYVDQLRVFIYFWKRHLGYIHKYTHHPCTNCVCKNRLFGAPFEVHSSRSSRTLTHERTGARTCPHRIHNIHRESSNNFHTNFYPECVDEGKSKTQTLCNVSYQPLLSNEPCRPCLHIVRVI